MSTNWTSSEVAQMDAIISKSGRIRRADAAAFPGRTWDGVRRQAAKRRKALHVFIVTNSSREPAVGVDPLVAERWARGSAKLHRATVTMCIRRGITLPGMSADRTLAIAAQLGIPA